MVSMIWRAHVPEEGEALWPRPSDREAVDVPIAEARRVFGEEEVLRRLDSDLVTVENVTRDVLRPGDTVVFEQRPRGSWTSLVGRRRLTPLSWTCRWPTTVYP